MSSIVLFSLAFIANSILHNYGSGYVSSVAQRITIHYKLKNIEEKYFSIEGYLMYCLNLSI